MMRGVAGIMAVVLVGLPLVMLPSLVIVVAAVPAALLCAGGVASFVLPVATGGAVFALIEYALAVGLAAGPPNLGLAFAFGIALVAFVVVLDFAARIRGAAVGPAVIASQARSWITLAGSGAAVTVLVVLAAAGVSAAIVRLAHPAASVIAAVGVALAALGVAAPLLTSRRSGA